MKPTLTYVPNAPSNQKLGGLFSPNMWHLGVGIGIRDYVIVIDFASVLLLNFVEIIEDIVDVRLG